MVFSFENPYVVPFVGGGFGVSVPVHATALPLDRSRLDDNDSVGRLEPRTTYTFSMTAGAKLLLPTGERDALGRTQGGIAILLGFGYLRLWDDLEYYAFLSGTVGFEVTFPSLTPRRSPPTF